MSSHVFSHPVCPLSFHDNSRLALGYRNYFIKANFPSKSISKVAPALSAESARIWMQFRIQAQLCEGFLGHFDSFFTAFTELPRKPQRHNESNIANEA